MNEKQNKTLEWIEQNIEDCFVMGDDGVYHLDTFLLEDKYKMFVDPAKEGEDKTSVSLVELDANEIKKICTIYENLNQERKRASILYNSDETFFSHVLAEYKTIKK